MTPSDLYFDAGRHVYTFRGRTVPSVTDILAAITNFDGVPLSVIESARNFGYRVCKTIDLFNRGEYPPDESTHPHLQGWKLFLSTTGFEVTHFEQQVYHPKFRYAGSLNVRGKWKGTTWLVDLKAGAVPKAIGPQTSAYQMALEEKPRRRLCVQLKHNDYKLIACDDVHDFATFTACQSVWNYVNARRAERAIDTYA